MNFDLNLTAEELLRKLGIPFQQGDASLIISCPSFDHEDKNPSAVMHCDNLWVDCYACGFKASPDRLVKYLTGQSIVEFLGIEDPSSYHFRQAMTTRRAAKQKRASSFETKKGVTISGQLYRIQDNPTVHAFANNIGMSDTWIDWFGATYCKNIVVNQDRVEYPSRFIDRLIIPIRENNELIGIEARDFTGKQEKKVKYPKGGTSNTLWNIDHLDPTKTVIVCEGIKDTARIWSLITRNVTSTFGNQLTRRQRDLLKKYPNIMLFADNDEGGERMIKLLDDILDVEFRVAMSPNPGEDPGDLTTEMLQHCINTAVPANEYLIKKSGLFSGPEVSWS